MLANSINKIGQAIPNSFVIETNDSQSLRKAFGSFTTGVTVVTTRYEEKNYGLTVNSFSSVSLNPPLVMWCLASNSINAGVFLKSQSYAINVLSKKQEELSKQFCRKDVIDRFDGVSWNSGCSAVPIIDGCLAHFECVPEQTMNVGDHIVFIGKVVSFEYQGGDPLVFSNGKMGRVDLS